MTDLVRRPPAPAADDRPDRPADRSGALRPRRAAAAGATVVLLTGAWWWSADGLPAVVLPSPADTVRAIGALAADGTLFTDLGTTLTRVVLGTVTGVLLGVVIGALTTLSPVVSDAFAPVRVLLTGMPPVVVVMMLMIWLGPGTATVVLTVITVVLPQTLVATHDAVRGVDPELREMSRSFGVPLAWRVRHVILPAAAPPVVAATAVTLSGGLRLGLMAEVLAADSGIGASVATARGYLETATVFAWAVVAIAFAALIDLLVLRPVRKRSSAWLTAATPH
ncbi:ABC transporter permease [Streptomyces sp. MW-W600-10]|uniref:ABC transporter permease n=1 Tax=Streptomyces sp. MW-W600-10 TaxID=2829819 RepID=UPI001C46BF13|nr:ABC transporter permease subunit [Streptomyces sp. MW-W600-10]MBV7246353.1 ABC transporter permease subunit [Streptomyces sp. MW-W600-10]